MYVEILEYANKAGVLSPVLILILVIVYAPKVIELMGLLLFDCNPVVPQNYLYSPKRVVFVISGSC